MILSRSEIAAAITAYRAAGAARSRTRAGFDSAARGRLVDSLLADCAHRVIERPIYRSSLVSRLQQRVTAGTYRAPTRAIVEQLLGRLVAAKLRL